jgi:hypothetical protein
MDILLLVIAVAAAAVLVLWLLQRRRMGTEEARRDERLDTVASWPPQATRILTTAERLAYTTLVRAMPGYMVLAQVPVSRFTRVPMRNSYAEWLRRIGNHCADLVVCDMASQVIGVVHVQPAVGETNERARRRYARMARVLKAEGIPLHTWVEGAFPSPDGARAALLPPREAAAPLSSAPMPLDIGEEPVRDVPVDERLEMRDAPPSTWYDELDSNYVPLGQGERKSPPRDK